MKDSECVKLECYFTGFRVRFIEKTGRRLATCTFVWEGNELDMEDSWGADIARLAYQRSTGKDASVSWQYRQVVPIESFSLSIIGILGRQYACSPQVRKISPIEGTDRVAVELRLDLPVRTAEDSGSLAAVVGGQVIVSIAKSQQELGFSRPADTQKAGQ